jgi:hypothetical protein
VVAGTVVGADAGAATGAGASVARSVAGVAGRELIKYAASAIATTTIATAAPIIQVRFVAAGAWMVVAAGAGAFNVFIGAGAPDAGATIVFAIVCAASTLALFDASR